MLLHATRCPTAVIGEIHDNAFYMYTRPFRHAPAHGTHARTRPLPNAPAATAPRLGVCGLQRVNLCEPNAFTCRQLDFDTSDRHSIMYTRTAAHYT